MLIISSTVSSCSENNTLRGVERITAVEHAWRLAYINQDYVAISSGGGSSLLNLKTKKIQHINVLKNHCYAPHFPMLVSNGKKIIASNRSHVVIYDTQTCLIDMPITGIKNIWSLDYSSARDTIFMCDGDSGVTAYNCITKKSEVISIARKECRTLSLHPRQDILCVSDYKGTISLHSLADLEATLKTIVLSEKVKDLSQVNPFCKYSPDGSYIVTGGDKKIYIIALDKDTDNCFCLESCADERVEAIEFHPSGLMAMLTDKYTRSSALFSKKQIIHYVDMVTGQIVCTMDDLSPEDEDEKLVYFDLAFSPDGLEVILTGGPQLIRALVPFAAKKQCSYILFLLHQLAQQGKLSKDVISHCMNVFWKSLHF